MIEAKAAPSLFVKFRKDCPAPLPIFGPVNTPGTPVHVTVSPNISRLAGDPELGQAPGVVTVHCAHNATGRNSRIGSLIDSSRKAGCSPVWPKPARRLQWQADRQRRMIWNGL